jgi:anti-anti-sigma regulatory factor
MLRITIQNDPAGTTLELEGRLTGPWVEELKDCWEKIRKSEPEVRVALKAVTFIDAAGKNLLEIMHRQGVQVTGDGCMTKAIVEAITRGKTYECQNRRGE